MSKVRNVVDLMLENVAKETFKGWGSTSRALKMMRKASLTICQVLKSKGAGDIFTEKELCDAAYKKFAQLLNGEPFIRTPLSVLWFVKISMNPDLQQDMMEASQLQGNSRTERFQQISDEYFDEEVKLCFVFCLFVSFIITVIVLFIFSMKRTMRR